VVRTFPLLPRSRTTIQVDAIPEVASTDVSAVVTAPEPIVVERAMYLNRPGEPFSAGHGAAGVTAPARRWYLAEGATGPFFELFVLLANPNPAPVDVDVRYLTSTAQVFTKTYTLPASSRTTIWVDQETFGSAGMALANAAVSAIVTSQGAPIIVERAMWWPDGPWYEAHASAGATATGPKWALADGEVGGANGTETYVLLANTSEHAGDVRVTLRFENGTGVSRAFRVAANSRFNVNVSQEFPGAVTFGRFATQVEAVGTNPIELIVERAMYWSFNGVTWAAGTNALATRVP
jgi:hypothetical protein